MKGRVVAVSSKTIFWPVVSEANRASLFKSEKLQCTNTVIAAIIIMTMTSNDFWPTASEAYRASIFAVNNEMTTISANGLRGLQE